MNKIIQNKINHFKALAHDSMVAGRHQPANMHPVSDSLSKSIRNSKEADVFLTELNAVIKAANSK